MSKRILFMITVYSFMSVSVLSAQNKSVTNLKEEGKVLRFGNGNVELVLDRESGHFREIRNLVTGLQHKGKPNLGSWPFGMRLGDARWPELLRVEITGNALHPQKVDYELSDGENGKTLVMSYKDMLTTGGARSGVDLTVYIELDDSGDYFRIRGTISNRSRYEVTNLFSGESGLTAGDDAEAEALSIPGWGGGKVWRNPRKSFENSKTFGYPIFGSSASIDAAWFDLSGPEGGIGTGYLNREGLTMLFNVKGKEDGLVLNWQLLNVDTNGAWGTVGAVCGLPPGRTLDTGTWLLAPHAGDWHRMADIYREEYEKAFAGDYLTWETTSETAKRIDAQTSLRFLYEQSDGERKLHNKFSDVPDMVKQALEWSGLKAENYMITLLGQGAHYPRRMPDFLPSNPEAGGDEGLRRMVRDLQEMQLGATMVYSHLYYNHPEAADYVPEADTGFDHANSMWAAIGNIACVDSEEWRNLWKKKYIPGFAGLGVNAVYLDQGPTQYLICPIDGHGHGTDPIARLAAHPNGINRLDKDIRNGFGDADAFLWTEVGSDLTARWVDMWTLGSSYARGGELRQEMVRYTFPYHLCVAGCKTAEDINRALALGMAKTAMPLQVPKEDEERVTVERQFYRIRRELRDSKAPGYPEGFRDEEGISVDDSNLVAKVFTRPEGITLVYYAREDLEAHITVSPEILPDGMEDRATEVPVKLSRNEAGYTIVAP